MQELQKKWTLVFFTENDCDKTCQEKLYKLRQIRLAIGKDREKVERLLVVNNGPKLLQRFLRSGPSKDKIQNDLNLTPKSTNDEEEM